MPNNGDVLILEIIIYMTSFGTSRRSNELEQSLMEHTRKFGVIGFNLAISISFFL
ncbi:hypothetical protein OROHE_010263 [Orobanche hederae]